MPIKKLKKIKTKPTFKKTKIADLPPLPEAKQEVYHYYYPEKHRRFDFGKLSFGLFLLVLGILYLAKSTGWLNINFQIEIWQLWPLLVIFLGMSLLTGRTIASLFAGIILTITVLTIAFIMLLGQTGTSFNVQTGSGASNNILNTSSSRQSFPINIIPDASTKEANFVIKSNFSNLTLGGGASQLASGQLDTNFTELISNSQTIDTTQTVNIEARPKFSLPGSNVSLFKLQLNDKLTSTVYLESSASNVNFNLAGLASSLVNINAVASTVNLDMTQGQTQLIDISAKATTVNLTLPADAGVRLIFKDKPAAAPNKLKKLDNFTYQTAGYQQSTNKINVNLDLTASSLNIK